MGGTSEKKTETKVEPWDGAKPYLLEQYAAFDKALKAGQPQYFQGSTIADQSDATKGAMAGMLNYANNNNANALLNNAQTATNNVMQNGGQNYQSNNVISQLMQGLNLGSDPTSQRLNNLLSQTANNNGAGNAAITGVMNGSNPGLSATQNAMNGMSGGNPTSQNLAGMASGSMVGSNPYLSQMVSNQQDTIAEKLKTTTLPGLQSQAAALGRSGSGAFANLVNNANTTAANEMSKVATDMFANQYNQDVGQMMNANNLLSQNYNNQNSQNLTAAGQLGQQYLAQNDQRLNAGTALNSSNNALSQLMAGLYGQQSQNYQNGVTNNLNNANLQMNAANAGSTNAANVANASLTAAGQAGNAWQNGLLPSQLLGTVGEAQDGRAQDVRNAEIQEWDFKQQMPLTQIGNFVGLLNNGGYSNQSSVTTQKSNGLSQLFGGLTSALGLASKLPVLCDATLKENVKYLRTNDLGIRMYSFNYIGTNITGIGPMAQEVLETHPELVGELQDGTLYVRGAAFGEAA